MAELWRAADTGPWLEGAGLKARSCDGHYAVAKNEPARDNDEHGGGAAVSAVERRTPLVRALAVWGDGGCEEKAAMSVLFRVREDTDRKKRMWFYEPAMMSPQQERNLPATKMCMAALRVCPRLNGAQVGRKANQDKRAWVKPGREKGKREQKVMKMKRREIKDFINCGHWPTLLAPPGVWRAQQGM